MNSERQPIFEVDPMLGPLITKLRGADDLMSQAVGMIVEQQSKTSKEVSYQSTELHDIKRDVAEVKTQSHNNGLRIATLEGLNLASVVKENAANTAWRSRREHNWKRIAAAAAVIASIALFPMIEEFCKTLARHLFP